MTDTGAPSISPARALRDAIEPLATICWWSEPANERYAALGLVEMEGYVYSRASTLGDADPAVVAAAFGAFKPSMITETLTAARAKASLEQIRSARLEGTLEALHAVLGDADEVKSTVKILRRGLDAAVPMGRALFAGAAGLGWPGDELGDLWHACVLLREYRGDGHLAACVVARLDAVEANILTELWNGYSLYEYTGTRAWSDKEMDAAARRLRERGLIDGETLSAAGTTFRDTLEERTDATVQSVIDAMGPDLETARERCETYARAVTGREWFPADPRKRAAG